MISKLLMGPGKVFYVAHCSNDVQCSTAFHKYLYVNEIKICRSARKTIALAFMFSLLSHSRKQCKRLLSRMPYALHGMSFSYPINMGTCENARCAMTCSAAAASETAFLKQSSLKGSSEETTPQSQHRPFALQKHLQRN